MSKSIWQVTTLGKVLELKRGYDLPRRLRTFGHVPLYSSAGHSDFHNESKVDGPGVITGRYGTIGEVYYSQQNFWPLNTTLYVRDFKGNDPKFVYYFLQTLNYSEYSDKAAVPGVNRNHLHLAEIEFPFDQQVQKAIAHILGTLDDKIELNRQMNATLEGMAQALFKSWFVDFDPVLDNALVAENPIPEALAERAATRREALANGSANRDVAKDFPDRFQLTEELGWIPEGWLSTKFSEILEVKYGKDHKKLKDGNIPVYGSGGLMRLADKSLFSGESVLIPRKGTLSNILYLDQEFWTVDTMFFTIPLRKYVAKYAFYVLKQLDFTSMNVGSAVPSMTTKILNALPMILPSDELLINFDSLVANYFGRMNANIAQSNCLSNLRDTLLPKLISGELRIPDAEKLAAEAGA